MTDTAPSILDADPELAALILQGEHAVVGTDKIEEHPDNPRKGDVEAIKTSIRENGFYGELIVQRSTGHVCAGNHRLRALRELGAPLVPVLYLDIDNARARKILAVDNRTSDLGTYDEQGLVALLQTIGNESTLIGTGYDQDDVDDLVAIALGSIGEMTDGMTPGERVADYEAAGVRSIVLPYNVENYEHVVERLSALCNELELSSNSDVVLYLVDHA